MQLRRVLLLFALVLGLSALVASIAPQPETRDEAAEDAPAGEPASPVRPAAPAAHVSLPVRGAGAPPAIRRVTAGSRFSLEVSVPEPGDVLLDGLGLRLTADPRSPARFELLAKPPGRHAVAFVPVDGDQRTVGRLVFEEPATVTPRRRDR